MLEKIENRLNKGGRKQRGRKQLKRRVNITHPIDTIGIYSNKNVEMKLEQFKQIKSDLTKLVSGQFKIIFTVLPNKPFTKKGVLVRMGKGKGKIDHFSCKIVKGTRCIILKGKTEEKIEIRETIKAKFERKYPFLSFRSFKSL